MAVISAGYAKSRRAGTQRCAKFYRYSLDLKWIIAMDRERKRTPSTAPAPLRRMEKPVHRPSPASPEIFLLTDIVN
jgi:hypothetical protein